MYQVRDVEFGTPRSKLFWQSF